jgi:hypothetical protein
VGDLVLGIPICGYNHDMGKVVESITEDLRAFIESQHMFFVATAPDRDGRVNLSPKGLDSFRILSPTRVAYLDLTGSGNETAAHVIQNGRITFMFCAFEGKPQILRLYGNGRVVLPDSSAWADLIGKFPDLPGIRQIIVADISRVQTSCGYSVPFMAFTADRDTGIRWAEAKGPDGLREYREQKNRQSIDGLPTS